MTDLHELARRFPIGAHAEIGGRTGTLLSAEEQSENGFRFGERAGAFFMAVYESGHTHGPFVSFRTEFGVVTNAGASNLRLLGSDRLAAEARKWPVGGRIRRRTDGEGGTIVAAQEHSGPHARECGGCFTSANGYSNPADIFVAIRWDSSREPGSNLPDNIVLVDCGRAAR